MKLATLETNDTILAEEIAALSTDQLKQELAEGLRLTAGNLLRLAFVVRALEDRGEDLGNLQTGLLSYLRLIAYGQLLPEIVVRFAGSPQIMRRASSLPIPDQKKLAAGESVKMIVLAPTGTTHRMIDPLHLTKEQVHQVFAQDHIRDEREQIAIAEQKRQSPIKPRTVRKRVQADPERGGVTIGRAFASQADVLTALAALNGPEEQDHGDRTCAATAPLNETEFGRLSARAGQNGVSKAELIRRALRAAGLI